MRAAHLLGAAAALGFVFTACERAPAPDPAPDENAGENPQAGAEVTVRGVLKHFPQDVKSVGAWLGHEFVVDETPIRPTKTVPAEELRKLTGKTVTVEGTWNPGKVREPGPEEHLLSTPRLSDGESRIVGSGVEATAVIPAER